jgi:hypothetical protein
MNTTFSVVFVIIEIMDASLRTAISATLHCLTGCAIGEILGMVLGTAWGLHDVAMIVLAIVLAFVFGYGLTAVSMLRNGMGARRAIKIALASDTVSITTMEIVDNLVIVFIPGALSAGLNTSLFWISLAISLVAAFVVTVPVNRWLIGRGMGHAHAHSHHDHH